MQLGKFSNDRDSALHYLCTSEWSNESFGDVESPTGYVWRISNTWEEVKPTNTEFNSVITEWLRAEVRENWFQLEALTEELRKSLVGHFLLQEDSNGLVHVREYATEKELLKDFQALETEHFNWDSQEED